jgi:hypothetical protein
MSNDVVIRLPTPLDRQEEFFDRPNRARALARLEMSAQAIAHSPASKALADALRDAATLAVRDTGCSVEIEVDIASGRARLFVDRKWRP